MLQTSFNDVNLQKFLADTEPNADAGNGHTQGKMSGSLAVKGQINNARDRIGECRLAISDMEVGKLSPLAKILAVLKLSEPTDYAFDQMFVRSYIEGQMLLADEVDLSGASLAFKGSGTINLQNEKVEI